MVALSVASASAFAAIVSLLADFRSQRKSDAADTFEEFMAFLSEERHKELKDLISQSAVTTIGIKALLHQDRTLVLEKLDKLDRALASLASLDSAFAQVVVGIHPDSKLSDQAREILRQFDKSGASRALQDHLKGRIRLSFMDGSGGEIGFSDERFIEDDLHSLIELQLLRLDHNSSGKRVYVITRSAAELVKSFAQGA